MNLNFKFQNPIKNFLSLPFIKGGKAGFEIQTLDLI